ncbi:MAG: GTPase ObgE [Verrucomicrobia bacterium]|nr:GTPase ObgE [Verrucomicrobiota bacterium]
MFVDQIRIHAKAGDGGNGCVSFRREKFVPRGGPNGGDGGRGGDIILKADVHTDNLVNFYYAPQLQAKRGGHGMGKNMYGRAGPNSVHKVPVGTLVYRISTQKILGPNIETSLTSPADLELVADLTNENQELILCKGGEGGKGNTHFKSSINRVPRQYTEGEPGEESHFFLELRKIADAALVGYPNAGKSTLLSAVSSAHPKIAPYPFTTLNPVIGIIELDDYKRLAVADIPGLIEGAHRNVGLGHDFLRHIERCKLLVFVVDAAGSEGRNPVEDLGHLRRELDLYDPTLSQRQWFIVANKMDLPGAAENVALLKSSYPDQELVLMAASHQEGVDEFKSLLARSFRFSP